eukprot:GHVP01003746.1.p2 GENE.GHVP01003746.1~~GHVP01003746.1.p2  ORF type:complete len:821 (+),score=159.21 GHVP01003746.1:4976-7438(+)
MWQTETTSTEAAVNSNEPSPLLPLACLSTPERSEASEPPNPRTDDPTEEKKFNVFGMPGLSGRRYISLLSSESNNQQIEKENLNFAIKKLRQSPESQSPDEFITPCGPQDSLEFERNNSTNYQSFKEHPNQDFLTELEKIKQKNKTMESLICERENEISELQEQLRKKDDELHKLNLKQSPNIQKPTISSIAKSPPKELPGVAPKVRPPMLSKAPPRSKAPPKRIPAKSIAPVVSNGRQVLHWAADCSTSTSLEAIETSMSQAFQLRGIRDNTTTIFHKKMNSEETELLETLANEEMLKALFVKQKIAPKTAPPKTSSTLSNAKKRSSVLGASMTQNISIALGFFKKSFGDSWSWEAFKKTILDCSVNKDILTVLMDYMGEANQSKATQWKEMVDNVKTLKLTNPSVELLPDEEFVHFLSSVPDLPHRLRCMFVLQSFKDLLEGIETGLNQYLEAVEYLRHHEHLPTIFAGILKIGNWLNDKTPLGNKDDFKMSSLRKIMDYKITPTGPSGPTVSIIKYIASTWPVMVATDQEIQMLKNTIRSNLPSVLHQAEHLINTYALVAEEGAGAEFLNRKRRNSCVPNSNDTKDCFAQVMREFSISKEREITCLSSLVESLLLNYRSLVVFLGDPENFLPVEKEVQRTDPITGSTAKLPVEDAVSLLTDFLIQFTKFQDSKKLQKQPIRDLKEKTQEIKTANSDLPTPSRLPVSNWKPPIHPTTAGTSRPSGPIMSVSGRPGVLKSLRQVKSAAPKGENSQTYARPSNSPPTETGSKLTRRRPDVVLANGRKSIRAMCELAIVGRQSTMLPTVEEIDETARVSGD